MYAVGINTSTRKNGNTAQMINMIFDVLKNNGIECKLIEMGDKVFSGCKGCNKCRETQDNKCINNSDQLNDYIKEMVKADVIVLGSPTYFSNVTVNMKALIERAGRVGFANNMLFKYKIGAAVVPFRKAGGINAFTSINHFFLLSNMIVIGSNYWNVGQAGEKGEIKKDIEATKNMKNLGNNIVWLLKKIKK